MRERLGKEDSTDAVPHASEICSLAEAKAPGASVSLTRAREIIDQALRRKVEVREQEALSAARSRIEADLGPRLAAQQEQEKESLSLAGVAKILRDLDVPPEIIDECLAGDLNAVKVQEDIAARKVSLGLSADVPQPVFAAEMSLSNAVGLFLDSFDSKLEAAKMDPRGEYFSSGEIRVDLVNVPFNKWRFRWTQCASLSALLDAALESITDSDAGLNGAWKVHYCRPVLRSTDSGALQRLIEGIEARGCEVVDVWNPYDSPPSLDIGFRIRQKG